MEQGVQLGEELLEEAREKRRSQRVWGLGNSEGQERSWQMGARREGGERMRGQREGVTREGV